MQFFTQIFTNYQVDSLLWFFDVGKHAFCPGQKMILLWIILPPKEGLKNGTSNFITYILFQINLLSSQKKKKIDQQKNWEYYVYTFFNQLCWGMQANQPKGTQGADYKKTITNQQLTSSLWRFTRGWIWWIVILTTAQKMKFLVRGITDDAASLCVSKLDPIMKSFYQSKFL